MENVLENAWGGDDGGKNDNDYDDYDNDDDDGQDYDEDFPPTPALMPSMPRMYFDNIPEWFHLAEAAFDDLGISSDCIRTVILMDSTTYPIRHLIIDIYDSEQYAQAESAEIEYPQLKEIILLRCTARLVVNMRPRRQKTATAWLLYLQCAYPQCDEKLIREFFHAGIKEHIRTFLRYQCPSHLPIWFVAYIANRLEQETHAIIPDEYSHLRHLYKKITFQMNYTHFLCPDPLPHTCKFV